MGAESCAWFPELRSGVIGAGGNNYCSIRHVTLYLLVTDVYNMRAVLHA